MPLSALLQPVSPLVDNSSPPHNWLPRDQKTINTFIQEKVRKAEIVFRDGSTNLHSFMESWLELIDNDPRVNMYFTNMFVELSDNAKESLQTVGITDYRTLIRVLDVIISEAPEYITNGPDIIGVPIYLVLNYLINTPGGMDAFMYDKVNGFLYKVLQSWADFLGMPDSAYVLTEDERGWLCSDSLQKFEERDGKPFHQMYICDPSLPHWGFTSWDHFFTRPLQECARPVDTDPTHVVSACESAVFRISSDIKASDTFWLKKETPLFSYPYSLVHMLNQEKEYVEAFEGGTVFQAFLSPFDYHRWHSPVDGTIEKIDIIPGTYYAAVAGSGDSKGGGAIVNSQPFLSAVATRAIFYINATTPNIGLVAFIAIGMVEVSTCHVIVREGDRVAKGDQLGMFQFGGSSHCLVFSKDTELTWLQGIVDDDGEG
ncbi:hypothetical protein BDN72DRAFT_871333 [Pluteus cervinus]|uniref:Uncharacterized protein n=1 Tax=Pluteus cervinus TaxID=181527 RepID=A0ACD3ANR8_9AGAR|nr:hypothetical protein BDN72DRAFT_871333 [Pluteus cervinus]